MEYEADKRSYRVLKLFETLQKLGQGAALDRKEFAKEMGVSERSVQRDIRTINEYLSDCENSSEIVYDRQRNGYRLCREDTCFLDKGEILAICKILIESRAFSKAELKSLLNRLLHSMISKDTQKEIENYIRNELFTILILPMPRRISNCFGVWKKQFIIAGYFISPMKRKTGQQWKGGSGRWASCFPSITFT